MRYAAVFFDAGETLVHPEPSGPDLLAAVLRREGHAVDAEAIRGLADVVFERFRAAAEANELWTTSPERSRRFWHDVYGIILDGLGIDDGDGLVDVVYREFTDLANYALFDDVRPALERLHGAGLTLGVVSNYEEWLERLLERLDVLAFFDVQVISGVEGYQKPDPRIFEVAMARAGVEPSVSVYVGDDPAFDVAPALALGMFPVLIDRRGRFPDAETARIGSLELLPGLLGLDGDA
jgi:putative hydrolase of the HAD superfamily